MEKFIRKLLLFSPLIFFAYTPWTLYPAIFGRTIIFQILIELILIIVFIGSFIRKKSPTPAQSLQSCTGLRLILPLGKGEEGRGIKIIFYSPIGISLIIFTLVQFISYLFSVDREQSFWGSMSRMDGIFSWLHMVAFYFLLVLFFSDKIGPKALLVGPEAPEALRAHSAWIKFFWINSIVASILSILAIIQHYHDLVPKYIIQSGRVYATFGNPVFFAPYLIFTIFLSLYLISRIRLIGRIGLIGLIGSQIIALFWTGSQGAIGGFLVGVLMVGLISLFGPEAPRALRARYIKLIGLIGLIGLIIFVGFSKLGLSQFLKSREISKIEGLETRLTAWKMGLQGWRERPIFGFGPSTFEYIFDKYYEPALLKHSFYETVSNKPHNILIETLTHTGLAGFLSYLGIFVAAIFSLWRRRSETPHEVVGSEAWVAPEAPVGASGATNGALWAQSSLSVVGTGLLIAYFLNLQFSFDTTNSLFMWMVFLAYVTFINSKHEARNSKQYLNSKFKYLNSSKVLNFYYLNLFRISTAIWRFGFRISAAAVLLAALWFGNVEAWAASVPAAKSENKYWLEKPIKWADEVKMAISRRSPYHDEIRVILGQDLMKWEPVGTLPPEEIKDQLKLLVEKLENSAAKHPNNFQYHFVLGQVQSMWGENFEASYLKRASDSLRRALAISSRRQAAYLVLGKILAMSNDLTGAEDVINQAVKLYSQAPEPHWFLGIIKSAKGELDEAVKEFALARDLGYDFRSQEILYWMGVNKRRGKEDENAILGEMLKGK